MINVLISVTIYISKLECKWNKLNTAAQTCDVKQWVLQTITRVYYNHNKTLQCNICCPYVSA